MSQLALSNPLTATRAPVFSPARVFALVTLTLMAATALLAGWAPLGFSIVGVFLFAGPHNWIELRYFMGRLPGRLGPLRGFFFVGFAGVLGLAGAFAALTWLGPLLDLGADGWHMAIALWNTALVAWIVTLMLMRSRQRPYRDWSWAWPVGFALLALNWYAPFAWDLGLVYLHPLVALWILDRELRRSRPTWRPAYHACLACLPLALLALWWRLADSAPLPGDDALSLRIAQHAGAGILDGVSSRLLVATHTFLESLHYSVWLIAIPLVGLKTAPWNLQTVPLTWRAPGLRVALAAVLAVSALVVLALWACFLADYPTTRDLYFTVAMVHVLAEVPFLLRAV